MNSQPDEKARWRIWEWSVDPFDFVAVNDNSGADYPTEFKSLSHPAIVFHRRPLWARRPENDMQALMEARPGQDVEDSRDARREVLELILSALDTLSEREQYIFDAWTYERTSIRKLAVQFRCSKSAMHRELTSIRNRLQSLLDSDPTVRVHLRNHA